MTTTESMGEHIPPQNLETESAIWLRNSAGTPSSMNRIIKSITEPDGVIQETSQNMAIKIAPEAKDIIDVLYELPEYLKTAKFLDSRDDRGDQYKVDVLRQAEYQGKATELLLQFQSPEDAELLWSVVTAVASIEQIPKQANMLIRSIKTQTAAYRALNDIGEARMATAEEDAYMGIDMWINGLPVQVKGAPYSETTILWTDEDVTDEALAAAGNDHNRRHLAANLARFLNNIASHGHPLGLLMFIPMHEIETPLAEPSSELRIALNTAYLKRQSQ